MAEALMRYFLVEDEDFDLKVQIKLHERATIAEQWASFARAHGAITAHSWQFDGSFAGFSFDTQPCTDTYKRVGDMWVPMKTKPKGKKVWKLARLLPPAVSHNDVLKDYGINWAIPVMVGKSDPMYACIVGHVDKPGWFVKVPSRHFSSAQLEQYRLAGTTSDGRTTSPLWQPPAAWLEISEWAFLEKFQAQTEE